ncbi:anaerobic ribonucleoside-triphosphate reductase activating protein [Helicobacter sp. 16-1353]|uniref:anaerobic ribonucleoside-triphosphate reductase activating protein n=1 Tax=Helicobacter sp. 16-1353 TaxID=2004996 RepID=UPI000DCB29A1|nr:anaerobic ribonucleoside-triphosphate reductase activating protein [Helicobacter sp. 16-1353]RAX54844.1 anaerobic ribonucleoside-triphosphate reductase activating protein [Helicobacter sp. 16-1353]
MNDKPIHSITPFTMLDFPDKLACIFWFSGCNMACPYCYNVEFLKEKGKITKEYALNFLDSRKGLLDGVVLSGGEATLYKDLISFAQSIKQRNFLLKLDTNASNPLVLEKLIYFDLLDYVSLDFKALKAKEHIFIKNFNLFDNFLKCLKLLQESKISFSVRTTLHSDILNVDDVVKMEKILRENGYEKEYFLQHFVFDKETLKELPKHDREQYKGIKNIVFTN